MTLPEPAVITYRSTRFTIPLPDPYEVAVRRYEELVPPVGAPVPRALSDRG